MHFSHFQMHSEGTTLQLIGVGLVLQGGRSQALWQHNGIMETATK